jgi:hypothetical protein
VSVHAAIGDASSAFGVLSLLVLVAIGAAVWFAYQQRQEPERPQRRQSAERLVGDVPSPAPPAGSPRAPSRPWWGSPWTWVAVCVVFAVLGLVVWPGLFGGTFLLLPLVWIRRPRGEGRMDPRTNGHTERDPESFTGD